MFKTKTVFVVGAGASAEVGLPVGETLKNQIADLLRLKGSDQRGKLSSGDPDVATVTQIAAHADGARQNENKYFAAARSIASAMPQALSIDNFLDAHAGDKFITLMGKVGIAAAILKAEQTSRIHVNRSNIYNRINFADTHDIWHNAFCRMATEGVKKADLEFIFDKIAIVTFNYDRCIEHYVAEWLSNYFLIGQDEARTIVKSLKIYHPYGRIGELPWQRANGKGLEYGADADGQTLFQCAGQLRTFTERVADDDLINEIKSVLAVAEKVVYLGFSFAPQNMELMRPTGTSNVATVLATCFGISGPNKRRIRELIVRTVHPTNSSTLEFQYLDGTCSDLFKDHWQDLAA